MHGLDGKLEAAVSDCKDWAIGEFTKLRQQLHTWAFGIKAEIAEITETLRSGKRQVGRMRSEGFEGMSLALE